MLLTAAAVSVFLKDFEWLPVHKWFLEEGIIPWSIGFFFWTAMAVLFLKSFYIGREIQAIDEVDAICSWEPQQHTSLGPSDATRIVKVLKECPNRLRRRMVARRIEMAFVRLVNANASAGVEDILKMISDKDREVVAASYSAIRVLDALIPILGFLGTVYGIGVGITDFSSVLQFATSFESVKPAINDVAKSLGLAFDTTLVALIASGIILLFNFVIEKYEDNGLAAIDDYCIERIVARIKVPAPGFEEMRSMVTQNREALQEGIGKLVTQAVAAMRNAGEKIEEHLGGARADIGKAVAEFQKGSGREELTNVARSLHTLVDAKLKEVQARLDDLVKAQREPANEIRVAATGLKELGQQLYKLGPLVETLHGMGDLGAVVKKLVETRGGLRPAMDNLSSSMAEEINKLLMRLLKVNVVAHRLGDLSDKQVKHYREFDFDAFLHELLNEEAGHAAKQG